MSECALFDSRLFVFMKLVSGVFDLMNYICVHFVDSVFARTDLYVCALCTVWGSLRPVNMF